MINTVKNDALIQCDDLGSYLLQLQQILIKPIFGKPPVIEWCV